MLLFSFILVHCWINHTMSLPQHVEERPECNRQFSSGLHASCHQLSCRWSCAIDTQCAGMYREICHQAKLLVSFKLGCTPNVMPIQSISFLVTCVKICNKRKMQSKARPIHYQEERNRINRFQTSAGIGYKSSELFRVHEWLWHESTAAESCSRTECWTDYIIPNEDTATCGTRIAKACPGG